MKIRSFLIYLFIGKLSLLLLASGNAIGAEVNVYSSRKEALILPILDRFAERMGIEVNLLTGKDDALIQRLALEGDASPADILITADVARLYRAKTKGLLQPVTSQALAVAVASNQRDTDNQWFAITSRARPIMYAHERVSAQSLSTYEALADDQWRGRICMRSSSNVYNQSLVASKLIVDGEAETLQWLQGFVANFARPPAGGDTDQLKAVAAGVCDIALANTYYLARLSRSAKASDQAVASKLKVFWPNQTDRGTHFNISGIAMTKAAKNKSSAQALMEFMLTEEAQEWYAQSNNEYPVVDGVPSADALLALGTGKADSTSLAKIGEFNQQAVRLMDQAKWR